MKRILLPYTNRVHRARQQLLLNELKKEFEVSVVEYETSFSDILDATFDYTGYFKNVIRDNFDLALIRADRFEVLPIAMLCAYKGIPIAHIEGGDLSGAIDNKVRHAITQLSDIHFTTNPESQRRVIQMGAKPERVFNFGSLDVEYAKSISLFRPQGKYIVVVFHPIKGEDSEELEKGIAFYEGDVKRIKSNKDSGKVYGTEEYTPEEYVRLIANAQCLVGNSSSFLKEASIFGTPVVNVGNRQAGRLKPHNVLDSPVDSTRIEKAVKYQINQGRYEPDYTYYQPNTAKNITKQIKEFLA